MAGPAKPPAGEGAPAAPPAKRSKLPLVIVAVVVLLAAGGGGGWFFFLRGHPAPEAKEGGEAKPPERVWKVGTIVVNVAGTEGRRYLRTTVELGVVPKEARHVEESKPVLMDAAVSVLSGKDLDELLDADERDSLREELRERFNETLGRRAVSHVFLTEFVIQ
jgi:flagellar FliL protein